MNKKRSEVLFYDPTDTTGTIWVYNYDTDNWYKFDGIVATTLFLLEDVLGFVDAKKAIA